MSPQDRRSLSRPAPRRAARRRAFRASTWRSVLSTSTRRVTSKCATSDEDAICVAYTLFRAASEQCRQCRDEVGSAGGPHTSEKSMDDRPPPSELAREVGQLARTRAARWFAPGSALEGTWQKEAHAVTYRNQRWRAAPRRGVHSRGANAQGSCIDMCCRDPTRRGRRGRAAAPPPQL